MFDDRDATEAARLLNDAIALLGLDDVDLDDAIEAAGLLKDAVTHVTQMLDALDSPPEEVRTLIARAERIVSSVSNSLQPASIALPLGSRLHLYDPSQN